MQPPSALPAGGTPTRITFGGAMITGRLDDTMTARDLVAQLPLTLSFRDLMNKEKTASLAGELSVQDVPEGADPVPGDFGYRVPAGNLVLYYGDVEYWNGIVRIGSFDGGRDEIVRQADGFRVTIERAD
jgi:hypothetical protein